MTKRDFIALATAIGETLAVALKHGGEEHRTAIYDSLYRPIVAHCESVNPDFDCLYFSSFVATIELAKLAGMNEDEMKAKYGNHEIVFADHPADISSIEVEVSESDAIRNSFRMRIASLWPLRHTGRRSELRLLIDTLQKS